MTGISAAVQSPAGRGALVSIVLRMSEVWVGTRAFERPVGAADQVLETFAQQAIAAFAEAEDAVNEGGSVTLDEELCGECLGKLAQAGRRALRTLFSADARALLERKLAAPASGAPAPCPTIVSESVPFIWELLFDGDDLQDPDPDGFWGLRTAPARILDPRRDESEYADEQALPSDMLFCVHEELREAHDRELPQIEGLVRVTADSRFHVLRREAPDGVTNGARLLEYLDVALHNMVHFACHCFADDNVDVLEFSLLGAGPGEATLITLDAGTFLDAAESSFARQPLVFLNACRAAGGGGPVRMVLNLPEKFVSRGAGAVIATACRVPDVFAAAFAREFYARFLGTPQMTIGEALRETRRYFVVERHNPLALAYGLYTPAGYHLATAPAPSGDVM